MCLEICRYPKLGHDGTPIMLLEPGSPEMREVSYVEVDSASRTGTFHTCKTWCWPPVVIQLQSMAELCNYMGMHSVPGTSTSTGYRSQFQTLSQSSPVGLTHLLRNGASHTQLGSETHPPPQLHHGYQTAPGANGYPTPPHTPLSLRRPFQKVTPPVVMGILASHTDPAGLHTRFPYQVCVNVVSDK
jgi:hypothetical protein